MSDVIGLDGDAGKPSATNTQKADVSPHSSGPRLYVIYQPQAFVSLVSPHLPYRPQPRPHGAAMARWRRRGPKEPRPTRRLLNSHWPNVGCAAVTLVRGQVFLLATN